MQWNNGLMWCLVPFWRTRQESVSCDDATRSLHNVNTQRLITTVGAAAVSGLAGLAGAWLVWNFIYAIGSRVVTDEIYARLEGTVSWSGCGAGAVVGLMTSVFRHRKVFSVLAEGHAFAIVAGFVGGSFIWYVGLYAYFGSLFMCCIFVFWKALFDVDAQHAANQGSGRGRPRPHKGKNKIASAGAMTRLKSPANHSLTLL
jgi:hypothetical protein